MTFALERSSFRDPSGSLFTVDDTLYRRVNPSYRAHYDRLMSSGLYQSLVQSELLIPHREVALDCEPGAGAYRLLEPERVPYISYPYEWCFSQLKDAARTTLAIQKRALEHGMVLKDASAYNVQFHRGKPIFIDTLSFETYVEGRPWVAYRQFCQHFVAPLALMSAVDVRLQDLVRSHIDGIPLDLASRLLPFRTRWSFALLLHVHLHAASQKKHRDTRLDPGRVATQVDRRSMLGLIDHLESLIAGLRWTPSGTEWAEYYSDDSYVASASEHKASVVDEFIARCAPATVWDLGANTGRYSRLAAGRGAQVIAFDADPACVERNYLECRARDEANILPLRLDLTNPSPGLGWANRERTPVEARGSADLVLALALIHHLAISNNVPLPQVAEYLAGLAPWLIVEFVPKSDAKVGKLLGTREDVFADYTQPGFEAAFGAAWQIVESRRIQDSERTLYLMRRA